MKQLLLILFTSFFLLFGQIVEAQKVLLLHKPGKSKRFLYEEGDKISIRTGDPEFGAYGKITYINDSAFTINNEFTFQLSKVNEVLIPKPFLLGSWRKLLAASVLYAGGSIINRAIHHEKPLIDNSIPIVSGSFIALSTTAYLFRFRHCKKEDQWYLKVLDFDTYNSSYIPDK